MMREPRTPWPPLVDVVAGFPPPRDGARAAVTFIGHSTFLIQTALGNILTDPMYSQRAGPFNRFGPERVRQPAIRFDDLPPIAIVLLSHNHYDHCDLHTLAMLATKFDPLLITPLGNRRLVSSTGLQRIEELDWWQHSNLAPVPITLTPALHFSARTPFDRNRVLWGGFVVEADGARIYFAGDTAYGPFFRDIGGRLGPLDLALIPIGAYEPRWFMKDIHVNPDEAVRAHKDLRATLSIGMHFGTFQLTPEAIDAPLVALAAARTSHAVPDDHFRTLDFGASLHL
jgi:L-ascorbate metabolism protein UlaG (beta-lactamase superfamily)